MKFKFVVVGALIGISCLCLPLRSQAQDPVSEIIRQAIIKVIKAMDLAVQRVQNKTIGLQNAQKLIENKMSDLKLKEISSWVEKQRKQYADYFDELWKVKAAISFYQDIKAILRKQLALVEEYKRFYALVKKDKNINPEELDYMVKVYAGIIDESLKNLDQVYLVIQSFTTQMSDARRLEIIQNASAAIDTNLNDLRQFNQQAVKISLQRAREKHDVEVVKELYGL
jgi:oligoendopeptidase F